MSKDLWTYLASSDKVKVVYGMGNGADKILGVCERYGIEISDFFASDGFVRGHSFHGKVVLSYSEAKAKYGAENMIVLLSFASSLPDVLENIYKIADECELYAPDVPVSGDNLFTREFFEANKEKIGRVRGLLCDERSREVFDSVVNYKISGDVKLLRETHSEIAPEYSNILHAESFEYIADLGAYNGDTLREIKPYLERIKRAVAFEPDARNFKKLSLYAEDEEFKIDCLNLAAWKNEEALFFDGGGSRNSTLMTGDSLAVGKAAKVVEVKADSLDNILGGERVDYIKFDVEGAEKEAIEGARETICRYKPALAVSVYHRSEDIFALALQIHELCPEYKFYMRRREYIPAWDTILFAVKEDI